MLGLWRAKFYEHAAFYGGTALRIFHSLPRFSEDMDFSLLAPDEEFDLDPYLEAIRRELASFGFSFRVERRSKRVSHHDRVRLHQGRHAGQSRSRGHAGLPAETASLGCNRYASDSTWTRTRRRSPVTRC